MSIATDFIWLQFPERKLAPFDLAHMRLDVALQSLLSPSSRVKRYILLHGLLELCHTSPVLYGIYVEYIELQSALTLKEL